MKPNTLKLFGLGLAAIGAIVNIVESIVEDKKLDAKVAKTVAEALNNK